MDLLFKVRFLQFIPRRENLPEAARIWKTKRPSSTKLGTNILIILITERMNWGLDVDRENSSHLAAIL